VKLNELGDEVAITTMTVSNSAEPVGSGAAIFDLVFGYESLTVGRYLRDKASVLVDLG